MSEKRLYRDPKKGKFLGICQGLGDYLDLDPVILRVVLVISFFMSCSMTFFAYLICGLIIPQKD